MIHPGSPGVVVEEVHLELSVLHFGASVEAAVAEVPQVAVVLQDVQHARHLREQQNLPCPPRERTETVMSYRSCPKPLGRNAPNVILRRSFARSRYVTFDYMPTAHEHHLSSCRVLCTHRLQHLVYALKSYSTLGRLYKKLVSQNCSLIYGCQDHAISHSASQKEKLRLSARCFQPRCPLRCPNGLDGRRGKNMAPKI